MKTRIITKITNNKYKLTCRSIYNNMNKKAQVKFLDFNKKDSRLIKHK